MYPLTYTADGEKLTKAVTGGGATKSYVSGIEYSGTGLEAIYFLEGRCTPNGASAFYYDYTIKDHLGNARVNFRANGTAVTHLEDMHYYPFGMLMEGMGTNSPTNDYTYNGKELNEDFALNLYDYGARWYDAALGRWWSVDPLAEKYGAWSGFNYGADNPIKFIDPDGMQVVDPDGNEICFDQEKKEWSENATEDVKRVGNAMMATETGAAAYMKMENAETKITITLTEKKIPGGYAQTVSGGKTESGEYETSDITIRTVIPDEGRYQGASEEEYLNAVCTHESVHATAIGEQRKLDTSRKTRNDLNTAEVKPMNAEYDTRTQYVEKQGRSTDAIRNSYENPPPNAGRPAYFGLDSSGNPRTKSRYEK
ncbi:MAG: RHS repeat-associated core domain-containing protein [Saprospiraceae bacterium]|nr:RHS repeat-associated core domain-containing protein [Saprospiraceae bacterium]